MPNQRYLNFPYTASAANFQALYREIGMSSVIIHMGLDFSFAPFFGYLALVKLLNFSNSHFFFFLS